MPHALAYRFHQVVETLGALNSDRFDHTMFVSLRGETPALLDVICRDEFAGEIFAELHHVVAVGISVSYGSLDLVDAHQLAQAVEALLEGDYFDMDDFDLLAPRLGLANYYLQLVALVDSQIITPAFLRVILEVIWLVEAIDQEVIPFQVAAAQVIGHAQTLAVKLN